MDVCLLCALSSLCTARTRAREHTNTPSRERFLVPFSPLPVSLCDKCSHGGSAPIANPILWSIDVRFVKFSVTNQVCLLIFKRFPGVHVSFSFQPHSLTHSLTSMLSISSQRRRRSDNRSPYQLSEVLILLWRKRSGERAVAGEEVWCLTWELEKVFFCNFCVFADIRRGSQELVNRFFFLFFLGERFRF
jgi:hypothetical protein